MADVSNGGQSTSATISRARKRPQASADRNRLRRPRRAGLSEDLEGVGNADHATILSGPSAGARPAFGGTRARVLLPCAAMPIYEYVCGKCGKKTEVIQRVNEAKLKVCPHCGGPLKKAFSAPAIQFKGSGWYVNDYARAKQESGKSAKAEDGGGEKAAKKPRRRRIPSRTPIKRQKEATRRNPRKGEKAHGKNRQEKDLKVTVLFRGIRASRGMELAISLLRGGPIGASPERKGGRQCCSPRSHSRRKSPRTHPRAVNRLDRARIRQCSVASVPISAPAPIRLGWSRVGRPIRGPRGTCRTGLRPASRERERATKVAPAERSTSTPPSVNRKIARDLER